MTLKLFLSCRLVWSVHMWMYLPLSRCFSYKHSTQHRCHQRQQHLWLLRPHTTRYDTIRQRERESLTGT